MSDKPNDIIITITIAPAVNGKRKVLISGAPEKEMPIVRAGVFADVHRLFDETWVALMKREPQVVKVESEKLKVKSQSKGTAGTAGNHDDPLDADVDDASDPVEQAIDDATPPNADAPDDTIEQAELPEIEGDTQDE